MDFAVRFHLLVISEASFIQFYKNDYLNMI